MLGHILPFTSRRPPYREAASTLCYSFHFPPHGTGPVPRAMPPFPGPTVSCSQCVTLLSSCFLEILAAAQHLRGLWSGYFFMSVDSLKARPPFNVGKEKYLELVTDFRALS